ncbi:MAG: response regulator [Proteobacteria bacterium]|jgi:CheY-like chemotaxis protein|nr:response regulator [Desulfocapsa sp.]MBU3943985.1 response regulator [Pseudomonadota bacterium]MCG2742312.1 response regulator [Desulfobacteraceae bacterium]MDO8945737.1 response regulator [Desulfocapsaceae bacterium]MBU3983222.1 response regulator [Pseudomonadota bacterium]
MTSPEKSTQQEALPLGSERILIVDDEPMLVKIFQRILEDYGYAVIGTTNSIEALNKVREDPQQFDLIVSDQTMPNLSGSELAKAVLEIAPAMPDHYLHRTQRRNLSRRCLCHGDQEISPQTSPG